MKCVKEIIVCFIIMLSAFVASAERSYDVVGLYSVSEVPTGSKAVGVHGYTIDVKYVLEPTRIDYGKYAVEVKRIGDNFYKIENVNVCVETKYCNEAYSFSKRAVLVVDSNLGYIKGKIIFY